MTKKHKKRNPPEIKWTIGGNSSEKIISYVKETIESITERQGNVIVIENPSEKRFSKIIGEFAFPFTRQAKTVEELKSIIAFSIMVWNTECLPENKRRNAYDNFVNNVEYDKAKFESDIATYVRRKHLIFGEYNFIILKHEVKLSESEFIITVEVSADSRL